MENDFEGSRDAYFILTCGGSGGNAAVYAEKLCRRKGLRYRGLCSVLMPENYLALFPTPGESESREIIEKAGPDVYKRQGRGKPDCPDTAGERQDNQIFAEQML